MPPRSSRSPTASGSASVSSSKKSPPPSPTRLAATAARKKKKEETEVFAKEMKDKEKRAKEKAVKLAEQDVDTSINLCYYNINTIYGEIQEDMALARTPYKYLLSEEDTDPYAYHEDQAKLVRLIASCFCEVPPEMKLESAMLIKAKGNQLLTLENWTTLVAALIRRDKELITKFLSEEECHALILIVIRFGHTNPLVFCGRIRQSKAKPTLTAFIWRAATNALGSQYKQEAKKKASQQQQRKISDGFPSKSTALPHHYNLLGTNTKAFIQVAMDVEDEDSDDRGGKPAANPAPSYVAAARSPHPPTPNGGNKSDAASPVFSLSSSKKSASVEAEIHKNNGYTTRLFLCFNLHKKKDGNLTTVLFDKLKSYFKRIKENDPKCALLPLSKTDRPKYNAIIKPRTKFQANSRL